MGKSLLSCRDVLWFMTFCGFAVNYMLRTNLNLAIVGMVVPRGKAVVATQCGQVDYTSIASWNNESSSNDSTIISMTPKTFHHNSSGSVRYDWNEHEQASVLGAYYWIHWTAQLPGGLLAKRYGTKLVFGWANLATALLGMLIPVLTRYHLYALIALRVLQGFISGVVWPSMHDMTAKWIPLNERGKFVSAYLGSSVGAAITYPLCALCIDWYGWEAAIYTSSLIGIVWYCFWFFLVFDSPQKHPRITNDEREYIAENISKSTNDAPVGVPWKSMLTSGPLWVTTIAHYGSGWGFLTFMTQAPTYLTYVHGWNINATGLLSGLPHILRMIFSYVFGVLTDWLLRTNKMSRTNVRKLATFVCTGVQSILTLGLAFSGCEPLLAIFFIMAGITSNGSISSATFANLVDISPNYASVLLGLAGLAATTAGFLSPAIVGVLTNHNQTIGQWRLVFVISAAICATTCVIYMIWGTSDEQPWNSNQKVNEEDELQKIQIPPVINCDEENCTAENEKKEQLLTQKSDIED